MTERITPRNATEVEQAVAWAAAEEKSVEVIGAGTKRGVGKPLQCELELDTSGLSGITLYEPEELVLAAHANTPVSEIDSALAERGQELAFEPVDLGPLFGEKPAAATIGGVLAANLAGPRRIKAGAARDHFLGLSAVSGRGETFKSGGRVVKNVTGYDLCKALAGSWGTLGVMTDVTIKVLPAAETEATILILGLDDAAAAKAMSASLGSSCEVSAAAHLPKELSSRLPAAMPRAGGAVTALRLEGFGPSVAYRADQLKTLLAQFGELALLDREISKTLWRSIGNVTAFAVDASLPLWRLSVAPMDGYRVMRRILAARDVHYFYDWGGGLVWIELKDADNACVDQIRSAVAETGGHATLMRAAPSLRTGSAVFQPQPAPLAALSNRLKTSFDPKHILNPGRMSMGM